MLLAPLTAVVLAAPQATLEDCSPAWFPRAGPPVCAPESEPYGYGIAKIDLGAGPELWVCGWFSGLNCSLADRNLVRWTAAGWTFEGAGADGDVYALEALDLGDGAGEKLYAGGWFAGIGGVAADGVAVRDRSGWHALGPIGGADNRVFSFAAFDDGTGPALYAGGSFPQVAGGQPNAGLVRWDGTQWLAVGGGTDGPVRGMAVLDDGSGEALYAVGNFDLAGTTPTGGVARWDGSAWTAVGAGDTDSNPISAITEIAVHDFGDGPRLVVGGTASSIGTLGVPRLASWDGSAWQPVATDLPGAPPTEHPVSALASFDAGDGPELWVAGHGSWAFESSLRRFDGGAWHEHPVDDWVLDVQPTGAGTEAELLITGYLSNVDGVPTPIAGRYHACGSSPTMATIAPCEPATVSLVAHAHEAATGATLPLLLRSEHVTVETAPPAPILLAWAATDAWPGVLAGGCGLTLGEAGELLLDPSPAVALGGGPSLYSFARPIAVPIPDDPSLVGAGAVLQGALFTGAGEVRLSNGLALRVAP